MTAATAIDPSQVARATAISTAYKNIGPAAIQVKPQRVALVGQGNAAATFATTKFQAFSHIEVGEALGYGSPAHLAARQLLPDNGDGIGTIPLTVYPLDVTGTPAAGDITPSVAPVTAAGSYKLVCSNIESIAFTIAAGATVAQVCTSMTAAINAVSHMPIIATDSTTKVDVACKWHGTTGNDLYLEVDGPTDLGATFAFTQPVSGATDPTVDAALAQVGSVWESMFVNCLAIADTTALGTYSTFGEGRWTADIRKPCVVFTGNNEPTLATAITVPDARPTDRTNVAVNAPGSNDLPFVIAARAVARVVKLANVTPAHDYGGRILDGLTPGTDAQQWTIAQKDTAIKAGASTTDSIDGVVKISDVVTMYHPTGDPLPAYRYVCDIVKLMNVIYNLDLVFTAAEWDGAPLIPDDQPTTEPTAKKPRTAKAAAAAVVDALALKAILSAPETTKPLITASIGESNPKRLDLIVPVYLAGNTNQKAIDLQFGFYFGG